MAEIGHCADVCVPRGSPQYGAAAGAVRHACGSGIMYRLTAARWLNCKLGTQMEITQLHMLTLVHMGACMILAVSQTGYHQLTALHSAAIGGHAACIMALLKHSPTGDGIQALVGGRNALMVA